MKKRRGPTGLTTRPDAPVRVGHRCGILTVIGVPFMVVRSGSSSELSVVCRCDCGSLVISRGCEIAHSRVSSCGCDNRGPIRHGESGTRLHEIWCHMKSRCVNPKSKAWAYYGGRGISVCQEWNDSYEMFRDWAISNGYMPDLEIDRRDVNGNYSPENCRWASRAEQMRNTRKRCNAKTSKYRGVSMHSQNGKWIAQIVGRPWKKSAYIGSYLTEIEAAQAYDREAIVAFGDYASLNFPRKEGALR